MTKQETKDFMEQVACPLVGVALVVMVLAIGVEIAITLWEVSQ